MADAIIGFSGKRKGVKMKKTRKILIFCIACVFATAIFFSFYKDDVKVSADSSSVVTQQSSLSASAYEKYISEKTAEHKAKYGEQTLTPTLSESIKVKGENYVEVGGIAVDRLRSLIERIERLEEEKRGIQSDIRDIFAEAKSAGFDVKAMRTVLKLRKMNAADRDEQELVVDTYRKALDI